MHGGGGLAQVEGGFGCGKGASRYAVERWSDGVELGQVVCEVEGSR